MKPKESVEQTSIRRISKVSCIPNDGVLTLRNFRKETNSDDSAGANPLILRSLGILTSGAWSMELTEEGREVEAVADRNRPSASEEPLIDWLK